MQRIHKILVGLSVALAIAIPLIFVATITQSTQHPASVIRVASEPTNAPRLAGQPCHGSGC
ncbi:MAG: hypothetical protein BroJett039_14110 [Chloroflexota bacterium]|nr:MAG: hypothetical protein BroJett039_14110 [Chloroflexota bacterium]